jgi:hypothetical protein
VGVTVSEYHLEFDNEGRIEMSSSGKKKTTMAKLMRESRLRERRAEKQVRKEARKLSAADRAGRSDASSASEQPLAEPAIEPRAGV